MSMTPEHIFYIVWFICAVITTYGASRSHMKTDGEVSLLAVAGLLNDYGGGKIEWWQDYIRAELARAHEFYQSQCEFALAAVQGEK